MEPAVQFKSSYTRATFKIGHSFDCLSYNVIYAITCRVCNLQYVGETGRSLKIRILEHCADTRFDRDKPVAKHFNLPGHSADDITAIAIDRPRTVNNNVRRGLEKQWIHDTLDTITPHGMNVKTE